MSVSDIRSLFQIFALTDRDQLLFLGDMYAGLFVVVAAVAGVSMCLQSTTFTTAGLRMTTRLRGAYFNALLRQVPTHIYLTYKNIKIGFLCKKITIIFVLQEIGYYDKEINTVGAICARLSGDAAEVQGATGLRIGLILQGVSSVVIGVVMGLVFNWKLTLVSTAFLPIVSKLNT